MLLLDQVPPLWGRGPRDERGSGVGRGVRGSAVRGGGAFSKHERAWDSEGQGGAMVGTLHLPATPHA